jgi:hypothetical protein
MATTKATKKTTQKTTRKMASKTGAKKASRTGRKGKKEIIGEPIIVGGGGGDDNVAASMYIRFPDGKFSSDPTGSEQVFISNDRRIERVLITGDLGIHRLTSPNGECQIQIWFSGL